MLSDVFASRHKGKNLNDSRVAFSIISIGRNCINSIDDTFRSVLDQNFSSFEYIIIDGASSDGTVPYLKSLIDDDSRVTLVSEPDSGISDAMNKGARIASGALIIHLHFGDKFIDNDVLKRVWDSYLANGWSWAAGNLKIMSKGNVAADFSFKPSRASNLRRKNCVPHQATFLLNSEFKDAGGFDARLTQAMDYDLWLRLYYVRKHELFNLQMDIACFDSAGESSKIIPLLKGNFLVRRKLKSIYGVNIGIFENALFLTRILAYWIYYKCKSSQY